MPIEPLYIAGRAWKSEQRSTLEIRSPYDGALVGHVSTCGPEQAEEAIRSAIGFRPELTRFQRSDILRRAEALVEQRNESLARTICAEAGTCIRDARHEVQRVCDILRLCASESLRDDSETFAGDISPTGRSRRVYTVREPLACVAAITPFNHPMSTVMHKLAPAVAVGTPIILKPSEKTPVSALRLAAILFEAGLPGPMLSVLIGQTSALPEMLARDPRIEALTFTGSTRVGMSLPAIAGYKRLALELGGNSELIVLRDADLGLAATLACEGAFRNAGQRCTAAKRVFVERPVYDQLVRMVQAKAVEYLCGDPMDPQTQVGSLISEAAAAGLEELIHAAVASGARLLHGGTRRGALLQPTVLSDVPRDAPIVCREAFGPIVKLLPVDDIDDAIACANSTEYGLATGVVTNSIDAAMKVIRRVKTGSVNVNELPGYRTEASPFGGVKHSGLGIKEGVTEACRWLTTVKCYSMPW